MERGNRVLARRERRFQALHELNMKFALGRSAMEILSIMANILRDGFDISSGLCALPPATRRCAVRPDLVWRGVRPREFQTAISDPASLSKAPPLLREGPAGRFLRDTVKRWSNGGRPREAGDDIARNGDLLMIPMLVESATLGYILVDIGDWPQLEREYPGLGEFSAFSSASALALSRVSLFHKLERRSEELASAMWKKEQVHKQLIHSERLAAVGKMAAGAAHEVNNPLAIISGRAQILLQRGMDASTEKQLNIIVDQASRASKILTDLMRFARPTLPQKEKIRINTVVAEVLEMFETQFRKHGIELNAAYAEDLPKVLIDRKQIQQVLVNMLINAEHAIEGGGTVTVRTSAGSTGRQGAGRNQRYGLRHTLGPAS